MEREKKKKEKKGGEIQQQEVIGTFGISQGQWQICK
jgi:hypothetical protein